MARISLPRINKKPRRANSKNAHLFNEIKITPLAPPEDVTPVEPSEGTVSENYYPKKKNKNN